MTEPKDKPLDSWATHMAMPTLKSIIKNCAHFQRIAFTSDDRGRFEAIKNRALRCVEEFERVDDEG